ncbi:hypothetical protein HY522_06940 [bacterium]|nr:hypothetical protein [bacterium]
MELTLGALGVLALVVLLDAAIRRSWRPWQVRAAGTLVILTMAGTLAGMVWRPQAIAGILMALACANAFIAFQRARSFREISRLETDSREAPYEQFVNTFLGYLDRGDADTLEFEFRNWRMEIRFKKAGQTLPVIDTPFHMILQIKRLFDAATVRNPKTGDRRARYVAQGILYDFSSEDDSGTLLRLTLREKRAATPEETRAFDSLLSSVR